MLCSYYPSYGIRLGYIQWYTGSSFSETGTLTFNYVINCFHEVFDVSIINTLLKVDFIVCNTFDYKKTIICK